MQAARNFIVNQRYPCLLYTSTSFMDRLAYAGGKYLAYKPAAICASARRAGTTIYLYTDTYEGSHTEVPDVSGKSAEFARQMLAAAGLNLSLIHI